MGVRPKRSRNPNQEMSRLDNNVAFGQWFRVDWQFALVIVRIEL